MMQCSIPLNCGHRCMGMYTISLVLGSTDKTTEVCSDSCKCQTCDRRAGGQRSMLKSAPNAAILSRAPPSKSHGPLSDSTFQTLATPPPPSGSSGKWHAYINGGAKVEDARMLQKYREEDDAFEEQRRNSTPRPPVTAATDAGASAASRLIETSPRKPAPSVTGNTSLLVDLDINSSYEAHPSQASEKSFVGKTGLKEMSYGDLQWNLLD